MRYALDSWDTGYDPATSHLDPGVDPTGVNVNPDTETPTSQWAPIPADPTIGTPETVAFIDGVMRIDANLTVYDRTTGQPGHLGLAASYAAGAVTCTHDDATVSHIRVERAIITTAPVDDTDTVTTPTARYQPVGVSANPDQPAADQLRRQLSTAMTGLETATAAQLTPQPELLVLDGPLRRRNFPHAVAFIKSHWTHYLSTGLEAVIADLDATQRSPIFTLSTPTDGRYSWYLRLPARPGSAWKGIVRLEAATSQPVEHVICLANLTQTVLPRYASHEHKDPRAPANLYPIGGLEKTLTHRLGSRDLLVRGLAPTGNA